MWMYGLASACRKAAAGLISRWAGFARNDQGSVAIIMGISLTALLGMIALGTEVSLVQYKQRQMQAVADASALSAALARAKGFPSDHALEGKAVAASAGFVNGSSNVTVTVNSPPTLGSHTKDSDAVEVIIKQPQTLRLAGLFTAASFDVNARAVALPGSSGDGDICILSTDTGSSQAVTVNNGARLTIDNCGLAVNSTGSPALAVSGGARIQAKSVRVSGSVSVNNGGKITTEDGVLESQAVTADPYAGVNFNVPSGCAYNNKSYNHKSNGATISPGTYCGGLSVGNGVKLSMAPGVYYIKSGQFYLGGGSELSGTGVTIVLTKNTHSYATANIGNGSKISLTAPTGGALSGIVFYGDPNAPNNSSIQFQGGASMEFNGALYFPSMSVVYSNGAKNKSACTQLIAWRVSFAGGSRLGRDCEGVGVTPIGGGATSAELVE